MSLPSSNNPGNSVFDEVDFQASEPSEGYDPVTEDPFVAEASQPVYQTRGFDVYSIMLIISFVLLTTAAIFLFIDAAKY